MSKQVKNYWGFDWNKWGIGMTFSRYPSAASLWAGVYFELLVGPLLLGLAYYEIGR